MRLRFRTRVFVAIVSTASVSLLLGAVLTANWLGRRTYERIERSLTAEARIAAELIAHLGTDDTTLDAEADRIGDALSVRATFVGLDGVVLGDSAVAPGGLGSLDNHGARPEVVAGRRDGIGISRRYSQTLRSDMLYVAARTSHPRVAVVRLAIPLTEIAHQSSVIRQVTLVSLVVALAIASVLAWTVATLIGRRVRAIATAARAYATSGLVTGVQDDGSDELGLVSRILDETIQQISRQIAELAQARARMEAILAGMAEGVLAVDRQGHVQLVNDAARAMLSIGNEALDRHYLESIRHPGVAALVTAALAGQEPAGLELVPARAPERRIVARSAPVADPGGHGAVLVLHDITDLHRVDQMRRDFVANVSHELRTPLTAIRGYVEALREDPPEPADQRRFLDIITRHADRMERLVKDLLRLAGLESRQEPVERAAHAVEPLVRGVVADLASAIESRRQQVSVIADPALPVIVTDAAKLQDALRNIVENAVSYAPPGSAIAIETATAPHDRIVFRVSDQGPGIPEPDLARIFERFYRVDKARSRESGGTGLGLSIVKHLVELLGGDVGAANRPGGGAVFTITLPARPD